MKTTQERQATTSITQMRAAVGICLAFLLAACGGGDDAGHTATATPIPPPASVGAGIWVVMGSSTASGAGASSGKGWVALMSAAYGTRGAQVVNIAQGGAVTYEGLSASAAPVAGRPAPNPATNIDQALSRKPALLVVSYPTNDIARGFSIDEVVNNLHAIRSQALAAGVPVLVTSTQPRNLSDAQLAKLHAIDTRLAASVGPCFVEVQAALAGPNGRLAPAFDSGDGVHPSNAGHEKIFAAIRTVIDSGRCIKVFSQQ